MVYSACGNPTSRVELAYTEIQCNSGVTAMIESIRELEPEPRALGSFVVRGPYPSVVHSSTDLPDPHPARFVLVEQGKEKTMKKLQFTLTIVGLFTMQIVLTRG